MSLLAGEKSRQDSMGGDASSRGRTHCLAGVALRVVLQDEQAALHTALLQRAVQDQVIPRLVRAHQDVGLNKPPAANSATPIGAQQMREFARLVIATDISAAQEVVRAFQEEGMSVEAVYLELLAPAARELGELWEDDLCDFADVTIGLGRLQQLLREVSPDFHQGMRRNTLGLRLLLLPSPGEMHTFGLAMVAELFRQAGWDVAGGPGLTGSAPVAMAAGEWFDVIGFSLASDLHIQTLRDCIVDVRKASLNRHVGIIAGGPIFALHPQFAAQVGADFTTADGQGAPDLAAKLVMDRTKNCTCAGATMLSITP